ncbi:RCC1 domain-containing protein [[Clostridium] polysaccharolyticum]|uniref:Lipoprotein n=1 Tax=[Clostridium] polysaccharolyticum TaxID=29364 RepID=A0A1H9Y519_9FIRM|nr:hypothetical protein [[Clostridium] polysaccharolyticum]SES63815.1 hypothetical protein SAMN04487772_101141 [[Clostridium] polysaccharolyticum]
MFKKKVTYLVLIIALCLSAGCGTVTQQAKSEETVLKEAISCIQEKKYPQAIGLLSKIKDNEQAEDLLQQTRYLISGSYIANMGAGIAALDKDGKVKIAMEDGLYEYYHCGDTKDWKNITSFSDAQFRLNALDEDGHIHSAGDEDPLGQEVAKKLQSYADIAAMSTDWNDYVLLTEAGKIEAYSADDAQALESYQDEIASWKDVVDVMTGDTRIAALKRDGTVSVADYNKYYQTENDYLFDETADWKDIVAISSGGDEIAGLRSDGTVVVTTTKIKNGIGHEIQMRDTYEDVSDWEDIIAISKGLSTLLGLKRDGTVVASGYSENGQLDVSDWKDIVAIAAGDWISVGLKADGTIVVAGEMEEGVKQPDISNMTDLYVPAIQY